MLRWIAVLLLIPFLDAMLLGIVVWEVGQITWVGMVLLVVLTGLVGMLLVRAEGRRTVRKMQRSLAQGKPPTNELLDGGLLIAAGAFLLTPGLVTDAIGFLFVVPFTRMPIRAALKRYVIVPYADKKTGGFASGNVYTMGFPNGGSQGGQADSSSADGTYDLGADDYTVEGGSETDGYTIDFGDERTSDADDLDDSDDPSAR
ncbi:FxsA family protein [Natronolimnohabitans innermongolicus]|uniref:Phage T7 F exclusion suppressor FxsA n=1 Tax=Natronolimnohabitans innermongolicus JCM 12255 TaxID=1227499 RepID=L9X5W5_9EURY|nr:FxsA family protein [Natronolimnohabitans innermongolicus]ELY56987.1 phage T7 F exclusion suppressor FxsA [Natronolimnohabitans innermongolicus JCM 12255]